MPSVARIRVGQRSPSDTLPLSPQARHNAAVGLPTFETVEGLGRVPGAGTDDADA